MLEHSINRELIFDIGTSEGNDTSFYLRKGFQVVSVEADPVTFLAYVERFANEIAEGKLIANNNTAGRFAGQEVAFWRNDKDQALSSRYKSNKPQYLDTQTAYSIKSIDWSSLLELRGIPHYCKVDIEGGEVDFLSSIESLSVAPEYISAEAKRFDVIEELHRIGYERFKLVDQKALASFVSPNPPREGLYVPENNAKRGSGLFGSELPGPWIDFGEVSAAFEWIMRLQSYKTALWTWFDCHAWSPRA